jgi:hypothetical protein
MSGVIVTVRTIRGYPDAYSDLSLRFGDTIAHFWARRKVCNREQPVASLYALVKEQIPPALRAA